MAEWIYEAGIGEARAALVEDGAIVEARIERDDDGPRVGAVLLARLIRKADATGRALVRFDDASEAQLAPLPSGIGEGAMLPIEIVRAAIPEPGNRKPAKVRPAEPGAVLTSGPDLLEAISASGVPVVRLLAHQPDALEAAGWSELLDEAESGIVAFPGGMLRIALTPAMTLIDVDGSLTAPELARLGAAASARAIRRLGIAGSIGIDLPTLNGKAERQAAAAEVDALLPQPFERTAVNGFGFLQIVRRRTGPSISERIAADPVGTAALALLRRAERAGGAGPRTLVAAPAVAARIAARQDWLDALARRLGATVDLRSDPALAISAGHVEARRP